MSDGRIATKGHKKHKEFLCFFVAIPLSGNDDQDLRKIRNRRIELGDVELEARGGLHSP
jgi:hypothetical protein